MTRWDWAQDLFEWFEYYLKGIGPKPDLTAQIQRSDGEWRIEEHGLRERPLATVS